MLKSMISKIWLRAVDRAKHAALPSSSIGLQMQCFSRLDCKLCAVTQRLTLIVQKAGFNDSQPGSNSNTRDGDIVMIVKTGYNKTQGFILPAIMHVVNHPARLCGYEPNVFVYMLIRKLWTSERNEASASDEDLFELFLKRNEELFEELSKRSDYKCARRILVKCESTLLLSCGASKSALVVVQTRKLSTSMRNEGGRFSSIGRKHKEELSTVQKLCDHLAASKQKHSERLATIEQQHSERLVKLSVELTAMRKDLQRANLALIKAEGPLDIRRIIKWCENEILLGWNVKVKKPKSKSKNEKGTAAEPTEAKLRSGRELLWTAACHHETIKKYLSPLKLSIFANMSEDKICEAFAESVENLFNLELKDRWTSKLQSIRIYQGDYVGSIRIPENLEPIEEEVFKVLCDIIPIKYNE